MSLLTTHCPRCGCIEVPVAQVVLRVRERDGGGRCLIRCPGCDQRFSKDADVAMSVLLIAVGIEVSVWPAERGAGDVDGQGSITHDELDAFRSLLADDEQLAAGLISM